MRLERKVALVTGAGSGIGRATAMLMAREGAQVVVADRDSTTVSETAAMIGENGADVLAVTADVTREAEVAAMVARAVERFGRLDCAFNNAGVGGSGVALHEYDEETWSRVIGVNLTGTWLCMKHEIKAMEPTGGSIVNNASMLARVGFKNACAYVSAKHGVLGLTRTGAIEYADRKIRVNAVCPGFVDTPMTAKTRADSPQRNLDSMLIGLAVPMRRLGEPIEIAEAVVWLCSDAASFVTGQDLVVDGGYTAR